MVMCHKEGRDAKPEQPTFLVVEAKRTSRPPDASSEAELFGQIKSQLIRRFVQSLSLVFFLFFMHSSAFVCLLNISAKNAHVGALTDGKTC